MKIRPLVIVLLLACLSPLGATQITHLHLGLGNDWYTLGLGDNLDDGLSFGGHLMIAFEDKIFLKADALGFTDRINTRNRYDQINVHLYTPLEFAWGPLVYAIRPLVGISFEGNFDFESVQNGIHARINRPHLHLTYDSGVSNTHLNLGSTVQILVPLNWVRFGLEFSYLHTFGWENSIQTLGVIQLGSSLTLKGGYSFMEDFSGGSAHDSMMSRLSGPTFSYYFDGGLVTNSWIYHVGSKASYGVFGIDVMQLFQPHTYDHTAFTYSLGILYDLIGQQNRSFSLTFGSIVMQTRHKSGPLKNEPRNSERRMTVASWMGGYQAEWQLTDLVYPYMKTLGGFQRFNLQENPRDVLIEEIRPTIALEAGVRFGRDGQWVAKSNSYRPRVYSALQYVFGTKAIQERYPFFATYVGPWIFLVGVGLDIGHDPYQ